MLNVVGLARLTKDPVLKDVGSTHVVELSIVTNQYRKVDDKTVSEPHYFNCTAWDTGAVRLATDAKKGDRIYIEGILQDNQWEDSEGNKRSRTVIRISKFEIFPKKTGVDSE